MNNSKYYLGIYDVKNCKDSTIQQINTPGFLQPYITDIAISPDGDFYILLYELGANPIQSIAKLDIPNNSLSILCLTPISYNSLTCDAQGVLYAVGGFGMFSYDLNTGQATDMGPVNFQPSGDITFRNNKMYCAAGEGIVEVNLSNPMSSQLIFSYTLPNNLSAFGIVSDVISCDSTNTYITVTDFNYPVSTDQLYLVDFDNQSVSYLCDTPGPIVGAATPNEFLASDCSVRLDLDEDDSSTATGADYQAAPYCGGFVAAADTDAVFYSGYRMDSLRIRLLAPAPDGVAEYLSMPAVGATLSLSGSNSHWLTLYNLGSAKSIDFESAIRSVRWQDDAAIITPGPRTVEFIAFAGGGHGDTAFAFLPVPLPRTAGRDTALLICADGASFVLGALLDPTASPGGSWQPALPGNGLFDPAGGVSATYQYLLPDQECPGDTAGISIVVQPLPVFSLGPDPSFCAGATLTLGPVTGPVNWQDGANDALYQTDLPGLYWAEVTDANGCRYRDSVQVTRNEPVQVQAALSRCAGQPYPWNGLPVSRDTLLCSTTLGANGCDSTHCLALSFFYPTLALDTTICAGQSLTWPGQTLSTTGNYQDTLLLAGCLTAVSLQLEVLAPVVQPLYVTICPGDSFAVGTQSFGVAGAYTISLQTIAGCDSTVQLQLIVQQVISTSVTAAVCPGSSYPWNGAALTTPGIYRDTLHSVAGCDSVVTLTLTPLPTPTPILTDTTRFCVSETTEMGVGSFAAYQWSTGATTPQITVAQAGAYTVTVTGSNGCTATATSQAMLYPEITASWETIDPLCPGSMDGVVGLAGMTSGLPPFRYRLNQGQTVDIPEFTQLPAGDWTVQVIDAAGCEKTYSGALQDPTAWTVDLGAMPVLEAGSAYPIPLEITGGSGPFTYVWAPATGLSCTDCPRPVAMPVSDTTYTVVITDANGCTRTASLMIRVLQKAPELYVPTVFSPNDDGENDFFNLFGDPLVFRNTELLRVYDRWGGLVFESVNLPLNQEKAGWNGKSRGKIDLPGIYLYYAEVRLNNGSLLKQAGDILLLR